MRLLGLVIGVLVILGGAFAVAAPPGALVALGRSVTTPGGLDAIAALRVALGLVFVLAARASRTPRTLRVLGIIVIIAGLTTPWFGVARARAVLEWGASEGVWFTRLVAAMALAIGGFLVYVFRSPASPSTK